MTLFEKALLFAVERHSGQTRKLSNIPYILHPIEVATIIATLTDDEEVICAGLLHDTVEDTDTTIEEIGENFGPRVMQLVAGETENKYRDLPSDQTWYRRKQESLTDLALSCDKGLKMLWLGDKLSNLRSYHLSLVKFGSDMWNNFNQKDPRLHAWYYREIAKHISELKGTEAYNEYIALVNSIFEGVE